MNLVILRFGVDTLECTFKGEMPPAMASCLMDAKESASRTDAPVPVSVGERVLFVNPKGARFYPWVLTDSEMLIWTSNAKGGPPPCSVKMRASALADLGHAVLYKHAQANAAALGFSRANTLSRIDLAADVQGFEFTESVMEGFVCPATFRAEYQDGKGHTYQYGKGDTVMRIYNKTAELEARPKKRAYAQAWESNPEYDPAADVWRVEVQFRGNVLREYGCRKVDEAFDSLGSLFKAGLEWGQLRLPTDDTNKRRWPVHPVWAALSESMSNSQPLNRIRAASLLLDQETLEKRFIGIAAAYGAHLGKSDYWSIVEVLSLGASAYIDREEIDLPNMVEAKRRRLSAGTE